MPKRPWHIREAAQFAREQHEVETAYPDLVFNASALDVLIEGLFPILDGATILDQFAVRITLSPEYPTMPPTVCETGGRIPKTADRHVNTDTGDACVLLLEDRWRCWPLGSTLTSFLDGPVHNYFLSQTIVELGGDWPFGQWSHGFAGQQEYYKDVFDTDKPESVSKYLEYVSAKKVKGHWDCPCGSGLRVRNCHMTAIATLRHQMPRSEAEMALKRLQREMERLRRR